MITTIAFDCFGTVFDMSGIPDEEIRDYVRHVKSGSFEPYHFPPGWHELKAHDDASAGIAMLRSAGFKSVTLSNGSVTLLEGVSRANGIHWDHITDLEAHRAYKPSPEAYLALLDQTGVSPSATMMVTANPGFGDIEGSRSVGMLPQVIRRENAPETIIDLASMLIRIKGVSCG